MSREVSLIQKRLIRLGHCGDFGRNRISRGSSRGRLFVRNIRLFQINRNLVNTALLGLIERRVNRSWIDSASLSSRVFLVGRKTVGGIGIGICGNVGGSMVRIIVHIMGVRRHENHTAKVVGILEIDRISKANKLAKEFLCLRSRSLLDGGVGIVGQAEMVGKKVLLN